MDETFSPSGLLDSRAYDRATADAIQAAPAREPYQGTTTPKLSRASVVLFVAAAPPTCLSAQAFQYADTVLPRERGNARRAPVRGRHRRRKSA